MGKPTVDDVMKVYALDAIDFAKQNFNIDLDYSENSVKSVETILSNLHDAVPKGFIAKLTQKSPSHQQIDQIAKMFGGYIGEIIKKIWGGKWKLESKAFPGQQVITLELKDGADIWPHFKCGKRLTNGPADNVWHYLHFLKDKHFKG